MRIKPGQTWQEAGLTSPPQPGATILQCGICGREVHRVLPQVLDPRPYASVSLEAETACVNHLAAEHAYRYRLWRRLGSRTRWPWRYLVGGLG